MAGVYRGMVDDAKALLDNSGADLWVVQQDTLGPYAESSSLRDDVYRSLLGLPGVARAANVTYLTMQVRQGRESTCAPWWSASRPAQPGARRVASLSGRWPPDHAQPLRGGGRPRHRLPPRRAASRIRRHDYTVVGLTRRMVSSGGDPMVFIPLKDAQEAQFLKDNDAILQ